MSTTHSTAVRRTAKGHVRPPRTKVMLLLRMIAAANGQINASDDDHSMLNYFCGDFEPTDTFNEAIRLKLIRTEFHDIFETSIAFLTDAGRAALAKTGAA